MFAKCSANALPTSLASVMHVPFIFTTGGGFGVNFPDIFLIFFHTTDTGVFYFNEETKSDHDLLLASLIARRSKALLFLYAMTFSSFLCLRKCVKALLVDL